MKNESRALVQFEGEQQALACPSCGEAGGMMPVTTTMALYEGCPDVRIRFRCQCLSVNDLVCRYRGPTYVHWHHVQSGRV